MAINEVAAMSLRDEFGASVANATWSSSDATIVSLSNDDPPFADRNRRWYMRRSPRRKTASPLRRRSPLIAALALSPAPSAGRLPRRRATPCVRRYTLIVSIPRSPTCSSSKRRRGVRQPCEPSTSEGEVLWKQESPGIPLMGDSFGGVLAGVLYDVNQGDDFRAYVRLGNAGGVPPWRYDSAGSLVRPAQAADGTIYAVEFVPARPRRQWRRNLGQARRSARRQEWPSAAAGRHSRSEVLNFTSEFDGRVLSIKPLIVCASKRIQTTPKTIGPVVGQRRARLPARPPPRQTQFATCSEPIRPRRTIEVGVDLVIFAPDQEPVVQPIYSNLCDAPEFQQSTCDVPPVLVQLVPDGIGGVLAYGYRANIVNGRFTQQMLVTRRNEEGSLVDNSDPAQTRIETIGQAGIAYVGSSGSYRPSTSRHGRRSGPPVSAASASSRPVPMAASRCSMHLPAITER